MSNVTTATTNTNTNTNTNTIPSSSSVGTTLPTANLASNITMISNNRTQQTELQKQIFAMDAKAKIDFTRKEMKQKFDISNIDDWFNTHLAKYQGIGASDETYFIHVGERIEEDLSNMVNRTNIFKLIIRDC